MATPGPDININLAYIVNVVAFGGLGFFIRSWIKKVDDKIDEKVDEKLCIERRQNDLKAIEDNRKIKDKIMEELKENCKACREKIDREIMPHIYSQYGANEDRRVEIDRRVNDNGTNKKRRTSD